MREDILLTDNMDTLMEKMSEDNDTARKILADIWKSSGELALDVISNLDDMNLRGTQIVYAWAAYCGRDVSKLIQSVKTKDHKMVDKVNEVSVASGCKHRACFFGSKRYVFDNI